MPIAETLEVADADARTPAHAGAGPCRARVRPARAVRVGEPPRPRVRPLADVLAELVRPVAPAAEPPGTVSAPEPAAPAPSEDPRVRDVVVRLLQAVVEVLDGTRPAAHLRRVADEAVLAEVTALAPPPGRPHRPRGRLRGVRVCPVAPGAVEVAGVVHGERRARALAARLEHDGRGWRFTVLAIP